MGSYWCACVCAVSCGHMAAEAGVFSASYNQCQAYDVKGPPSVRVNMKATTPCMCVYVCVCLLDSSSTHIHTHSHTNNC